LEISAAIYMARKTEFRKGDQADGRAFFAEVTLCLVSGIAIE
jgi:hypothetical protein